MPEFPLKLIPTVNAENTETLNEAGISSCNLIRFKAKLPQKLGGWQKYYPFTTLGIARDMHAWSDLNAVTHLGVAATQQLAVITNGTLQDITPQTFTSDFAPNFSVTISTNVVSITDPNISNVTAFDSILFNTPISVGGIILSGLYPIDLVTGPTSYNIIAATDATASETAAGSVPEFDTTAGTSAVSVTFPDHGLSVNGTIMFPIPTTLGGVTISGSYNAISITSVDEFDISGNVEASTTANASMNGGDAQLVYYINLGPAASGAGYGLGPYGIGGYGTGIVPAVQTGTPITATDWTEDNWGEILLACPEGGGLYYWSPTGGFQTASIISSGPPRNGGLFVSMPAQILVAWASSSYKDIGVQQDPLLVRWSDQENFFEWTVTSTTQAGSFRIPTGSEIRGAIQGPQQSLIFTDIDVYAMQYIKPPLVFGFNKIGSGCGLIGPHAVAVMRGNVYWMSTGDFFAISGGGVKPIPCDVWDVVFQDLDTANQSKCVAAPNSAFDEMWFFYPSLSGGTGECDKYVKVNLDEGSWDYGSMPRSAWIDQSVLGQPIGAAPSSFIYQHEVSTNADGQPLNAWFETGYFVITEAQDMAVVDWFFPDMKFGLYAGTQGATVLVTITAVNYPNATERVYGPFSMTAAKSFINTRLRGRQIKVRFESNDLNSFWRLGNMRFRVAKDGRR